MEGGKGMHRDVDGGDGPTDGREESKENSGRRDKRGIEEDRRRAGERERLIE